MSDLVSLDRDERGVRIVTIRRPEVRNALNRQAFSELGAACREIASDPDARVMVLAGEGKAFSAGGDFSALQDLLEGNRDFVLAEFGEVNEALLALATLPIPTVAAVHGDAYGGGASLALAPDFRIMAKGARLGLVFARIGLSGADTGATWWLTRLVGPVRANEILMRGKVFSSEEALEAGLVTEVVPDDEFDQRLEAFLGQLLSLAPLGAQGTKRALLGIEGRSLAEQLALEAEIQASVVHSADFREGLAALQEERKPEFQGT